MSDADRAQQAVNMAHLRPLPRCHCGKPATEALYTGLNALYGHFCGRHGVAALAAFKAGRTP